MNVNLSLYPSTYLCPLDGDHIRALSWGRDASGGLRLGNWRARGLYSCNFWCTGEGGGWTVGRGAVTRCKRIKKSGLGRRMMDIAGQTEHVVDQHVEL